MPEPLDDLQVSVEEVKQWLNYVEVGGKEFILSLEDSRLRTFSLTLSNFDSSIRDLKSQICMSLKRTATSVNSAREMNYLPAIYFRI